MFFSLIFFTISAAFGYFAFKKIADLVTKEVIIVHGLVFGLAANTTITYFFSRVIGLNIISIIASEALLIAVSFFLYVSEGRLRLELNKNITKALVIILLFSLGLFTPIFVSHSLEIKGASLNSGVAEWGDLALHTTLINYFINNPNSLNKNPIYSGSKLNYPPLVDFMSAVFVVTGSSLQQSLYLPAIILSILFTMEIFLLAHELTKKILPSALSIILILFNGGLGFFYFINDLLTSNQNIIYFLTHLSKDYAKLTNTGIQLGNIIVVSLIPQRSFLMGYTAGLLVIILVYRYFGNSKRGNLVLAGLLSGMLPLMHPHSLIAVCIFSITLIAINFKSKVIIDFLKYFMSPFLLLAIIPVYEILSVLSDSSGFIRVQFFWMADKTNPVLFYFNNLGILLILLVMSLFFLPKKLFTNYLPFLIIFIIANIFIFQPWDYDNTKILFYFVIGSSIIIAYVLSIPLASKNYLAKSAIIVLIFFTVFSGVLSVIYESFSIYELYNRQGIEFAQKVNNLTHNDSIILTSDQHNHPVTAFSGRNIVMGYRGWLWTWGYNYSQKEDDVKNIYNGSQLTPILLKKYNISYVVIGPSERNDFLANDEYFDNHYKLVLSLNNYKLFDATSYTP